MLPSLDVIHEQELTTQLVSAPNVFLYPLILVYVNSAIAPLSSLLLHTTLYFSIKACGKAFSFEGEYVTV